MTATLLLTIQAEPLKELLPVTVGNALCERRVSEVRQRMGIAAGDKKTFGEYQYKKVTSNFVL